MLSKQFFAVTGRRKGKKQSQKPHRGVGYWLAEGIMGVAAGATRHWIARLFTVIALSGLSIAAAIWLFPKMEYLPQGNRNLIINLLIPPPGLSFAERKSIGEQIYRINAPHIKKDHNGFPGIKNMFYVGSEQIMLFGAVSTREQRAAELIPLFQRTISAIPGMFGVSLQAGIFQSNIGKGRSIDVDVSGDDINRVVQVAGTLFGAIKKEIPTAQVRPVPSLELLFPEVRLLPDRDRLRAARMTTRDFGLMVDVLMDGRDIGDFKQEGRKKIDLVLKASEQDIDTPEKLFNALLTIPGGKVVPVSSLSALERISGISQIRHLERQRTITLQVTPPSDMPLQVAMEWIDREIISHLAESGALKGAEVKQSGVADKLTQTRKTLQWDFVLAAVISYLLMAALFGNFIYPFIILFTVPLAAAGGFIGLKLVNVFIATQPFDILTMLGFIILIGVVVNNAILIVYQALNNIRENGMAYREAVLDATRTRLRPIYMSATTSVFGMLPLVLFPGPGSELYRGLGSVVLGGLALSTVFTVLVIPALLMFFIRMEKMKPATPKPDIKLVKSAAQKEDSPELRFEAAKTHKLL